MKNIGKLWCVVISLGLTACMPDVETVDLSSVPNIPENMLHEQKSVSSELEADRQEVLKELNKRGIK